jgi:hypothetical protein
MNRTLCMVLVMASSQDMQRLKAGWPPLVWTNHRFNSVTNISFKSIANPSQQKTGSVQET